MEDLKREKVRVQVCSQGDEKGHFHRDLEIIYVLQGEVSVQLSRENAQLASKGFLIINSNKWHQIEAAKNALFMKLIIDYRMIRDVVGHDEFYFDSLSKNMDGLRALRQSLTKFSHNHLASLYKSPVTFSYLANCYDILDNLSTYFLIETRLLSRKLTKEEEILEYIRSHYNQKITLKTLSEHLFLSPTYVSRYFKKHFNVNFKEYLTSVRLAHAYEDVVYTDHSLTRIAYENGFSNTNQFNKDFKVLYKNSPLKIRKYYKEKAGPQVQVAQEELEQYILNNIDNESAMTVIESDGRPVEVLDESWKNMVNFGSAESLLESQYQQCALQLKEKMGFQYLRIWGVLSRKLLIDVSRGEGNYNFSKLNQIFDFFYRNKLYPHIELGPKHFRIDATTRKELRHNRQELLFKSKNFPAVIEQFLKHFLHRYGLEFTANWRFELWLDEDELSADFTIDDYFSVFQASYAIVKKYSKSIQVGGCGYPMNYVKYLPKDFFEQWQVSGCRPDFCSMMVYHYDLYRQDSVWLSSRSQDVHFLKAAIGGFYDKLSSIGWQELPIYVTEWNLSISDRNYINDTLYKGSFLLQNIIENMNIVNGLAYFIASDWVSEDVDSINLLHGGSGLFSKNLFLKPAAWAYQFLYQLDKYKLDQTEDYILTTNGDGQYTLLVHNNKPLNDLYYSTEEDSLELMNLENYYRDVNSKAFRLRLSGIASGTYRVKQSAVTARNDILSIWKAMNYADDLNLEEVEYLRGRSLPEIEITEKTVQNNQINLDIEVEANSFVLIKITT